MKTIAGFALAAVASVGLGPWLRWVRGWLARARADREREEYESRDWLDVTVRGPMRDPAPGPAQGRGREDHPLDGPAGERRPGE